MNRGLLILIDGADHTGKTTICNYIAKQKKNAVVYAFPSQELLLKIKANKNLKQRKLVKMFLADFKKQLPTMKKDVANKKHVIIDRMYLSTLLYATQDGLNWVKVLNKIWHALDFSQWRPDIEIILTCDPKLTKERMKQNKKGRIWLQGDLKKQKELNQQFISFYENAKDKHKDKSQFSPIALTFDTSFKTKAAMLKEFDKQVLSRLIQLND